MEEKTNSLNDLVYLVSDRGGVTPKEAAEALKIPEKDVLDLVRVLESQDILKSKYMVTGDLTINKGDRIKDATRDELDEQIKDTLNKEAEKEREKQTPADEIIRELRERIRKNRFKK